MPTYLETVAFLVDHGANAWSVAAMRFATAGRHDAVVALLLAQHQGGRGRPYTE